MTTCNLFSPGLGEEVDTGSPTVGIESHGNGTYVGGVITLTGYATDDLGVESVTISSDSGSYSANLSDENWSLELDTELYGDGDLELTITAVDNSGKSVSATVLLIVDNNPPTVLVTTPTDYGSSADADYPEYNNGFTLKGETADATRVSKVYISLYESDGTAVFEDSEASGTSSWYFVFNSDTYSLNGDYYFVVEAEDYSSNRNSYFYHIEDIIDYAVDSGSLPSVEEINTADLAGVDISSTILTTSQSNLRLQADSTGSVMGVNFNPDSDLPQFEFVSPPIVESPEDPLEENRFSSPQRFTGYAEDDDTSGVALVELAIFDYSTDTPVNIYGEAVDDSWMSYDGSGLDNENSAFTFSGTQWVLDAELAEGTYYIVLRAEDAAGASATSTEVAFTVSASAPSISINSPDPGAYLGVGQSVTLDVNVTNSDGTAWAGTSVYADLDGDLSWTDANAILMTQDLSETGHFTLEITEGVSNSFDFDSDGTYTIRVRAGTDSSAGNATIGITSDISLPTMTVSTPGDGETVNGTIDVRGTADDVAIDAVYVKIETGDVAEISSYPGDPVGEGWTAITDSVYNWTLELDTTSYYTTTSGMLTLHYFTEDAAGNLGSDGILEHPANISFTVDQDDDLPVISISQPTEDGRVGLDSSIIGNITDDDLVDVSTLMVSIDGAAAEAVSSAPASDSSNVSWSHSLIGVEEGVHTLEITVDDIKTNGDPIASSSVSYSFVVDAGPPSLDILTPSANSLWNEDVVISGTAVDVNGVKSMSISADGTTWNDISITSTTDSTVVNWSYTLVVDPDGADDMQYTMQIRAVDQADATSTEYLPFEVDTTAPSLEITEPPESVTINGDLTTIAGTVSDVNGISGLYYYIDLSTATPPVDSASWTSIDIAYSWSFTFSPMDYNSTSAAEDYIVWVRAEDDVDLLNVTDDSGEGHYLSFTIDQETDRPEISFNDIDMAATAASDNVLVGATSIAGLVEDDDSIDPSADIPIEISIDGGDWTDVDLAPTVGSSAKQTMSWKHDISDLLEGTHHVKLRARDSESADDSVFGDDTDFNWDMVENADLTADNTDADKEEGIPFIVNRGAPTIVVDDPANYSYHRDDVIISGSASDSNGVKKVEVSFDNGATFDQFIEFDPTESPASWSFTYDVSVLGSGVVSYIIQATDGYDSTSIANGQFSVDITNPSIVVSEPDPSDTVNGTISFYGTGGDDITLNEVYYSILPKWTDSGHGTLTADPAIPATGTDGTVTSTGDYTLATGNYSWSDSFDTTSTALFTLGDETYVFRVLAIDYAGNISTVTEVEFLVDQETDRPDIDLSTFDSSGTFLTNLMSTSQQVIGTIIDDDSIQTGLLQIKVTNTDDTADVVSYTAVSDLPTTSETWKHTFGTLANGRYNLYVRGADENFIDGTHSYAADNYYWNEIGPIPFTVDEDLPVTTQTVADGSFYSTTFDIEGTATDSNGIKSVDIVVNGGDSENLVTNADPFSVTSQGWARSYPVNSDGSTDGKVEWTVTVTDAFDKTNSYSREAYVDTQAPAVNITSPDNNSTLNGSIFVEGTSSDGDTDVSDVSDVWIWIGSGAAPAAGDAAWTAVTGTENWEYRFVAADQTDGTWSIYILARDNFGNYSDPSADNISITIDESGNLPVITMNTADSAVLGASDLVEGTIIDDDYVDVSTLQISFDNGGSWTDVANKPSSDSSYVSFSHPVTDIDAEIAAYQVLVRASDVGEDFIDDAQDIDPVTTTTAPLSVYVDKEVPDFAITEIGNGLTTAAETTNLYINDYIILTGTSSDDVQVQSVQVKIGDGNYTAYSAATNTGTNFSTWQWEIASGLGLTADTTISVLVTDYHGRTNEVSYQLRVDTTGPTISFTTESTNPDTDYDEYGSYRGAYNNTQTFSGVSNDNIKIETVYYLFDGVSNTSTADPAGDGWSTATGTYSWSTDFDTTTVTDGNTHYLHVITVDGAGNYSSAGHLGFLVHQSSDDPIVTLTQPTTLEVLESNPRAIGTVRDDDGLTSVQISIDGGAFADVDSSATVSGKSVSFEHSLSSLADGDHTLEIRATEGALTATSGSVSFDINKYSPELVLETIEVVDIYGGADKEYSSSGGTVSLNTTYINGDFTLVFRATDDNGIDTIQVDTGSGLSSSGLVDNGDDTYDFPIASDSVDLSEGANNITYQVSDSLGKTTEGLVTIILDTVKPVISFTSPSSVPMVNTLDTSTDPPTSDAPNVNGDVTIQGTVTDDSSIEDLVITGGINSGITLENQNSSNINWKVALSDSDASTTSDGSGTYANTTYSFNTGDNGAGGGTAWDGTQNGSEVFTNIWRFPIEVVATDAAGNKSLVSDDLTPVSHIGYIDIDPDGDKPEVTVVSPSDGASVSGTFLLNGTLQDDDGADYVDIQIDLNHDGDFDDSFDLDVDGNTTDEFEDESVAVSVDGSTTSWAKSLTGSYFDFDQITGSDNNITIQVTPYDINGLAGDTATITVYVDNTNPEILGLDTDGTTETNNPTPSTGSLMNGTETLRFRIEDDKEIDWDDMLISYDGGASYENIFASEAARDAADQGSTDPYKYYVELALDTTTIVSDGNGLLSIQISVADQTNKTNNLSLQYSVDNTLPTGVWDYNSTLTPQAGVYTFYGNETSGGDYMLIGSAEDTGTISGVEKVDVYFVKDGKFYNPSVDNSSGDVDVMAQTTASVANMSGTEDTIPYPTSNYDSYVISIDNRSERGIYDEDAEDGDGDGFQESLRNKGSYDEWYVYFDTELLPDGPLDIYYIVYDEAGNMSYEQVSAQVSNDPPSIDSYDIGGTNYATSSDINLKMAGTVSVTMNVSDTAPGTIDTSSYNLTMDGKYTIEADGSVGTAETFTSVEYGASFTNVSASSADVDIDTTVYDSGYWYEMVGEIGDSDGNIVTHTWWLWIANNDSTAPTVSIDTFSQDNVSGSGHIEEAVNSPDSDSQADLSGTVSVTGTAYDDSSVSSITLEISADGTTWFTLGDATVVYADDGDATNNVNYTWNYTWDTSDNGSIDGSFGVADEDIQIRAYGSDNATTPNTTAEGNRPVKTVDIVPYITDIDAGYNIGLKSFIKRSSSGKYTLSTDSSITIEGYNLPGTTADALAVGTTPVLLTADSASGSDSMTLNNLNSLTESGYLVVTTNGVSSRNNSNDNDQSQNDESSQYYPVRSDDRYIALWDLTDTGYSGTDGVMRPVRDAAGDQTGFEWMYVTTNDTLYIDSDKMTSSFSLSGGDFAYNDDGTRMWMFLHDTKWWVTEENNNNTQFFGSVQWSMEDVAAYNSGVGFTALYHEAYNWNIADNNDPLVPRLGLGNMVYPSTGTPAEGEIDRYSNLQIRLIGGDTTTGNLTAYYDQSSQAQGIAYVAFNVGTGVASSNYELVDASWYSTIDRVNPYTTEYLPTGNEDKKATGIGNPVYSSDHTTDARNTIISTTDASEDFVLDTQGTTAYLVWYDPGTGGTDGFSGTGIKLMYNTAPVTSPASWSDPLTIADSSTYSYLAMEVDPNGDIHLAYQDDETGFLNYTYLKINTGTNAITSQNDVLVDALFSSGQYNSLSVKDFAGDGTDYRPLITTFSSAYTGTTTSLRLVYPLAAADTVGDGADASSGEFQYDGNGDALWESIAIPASSAPQSVATSMGVDYSGSAYTTPRIGYNADSMEEAVFMDLP